MEKKHRVIFTIVATIVLLIAVSIIVIVSNKQNASEGDQPVVKPVVEEEKKDTSKEEKEEVDEPAVEDKEDEKEPEVVMLMTTDSVNLREEPNTDCDIIKLLVKGTKVIKISEKDGWVKVKYNDQEGYISEEFLEEVLDESENSDETSDEKDETTTNTSKTEAVPGQYRDPNNIVVVIDPGHQLHGESTKEPNGPGASVMKARVTSGTRGVATGVAEYILNLDISLKLRDELVNRGYTVYMTRSVHEISISNMERAKYASSVNADIAVRIHANGSSNSSVRGAEAYVPSASNPYVPHLASASRVLGQCIMNHYCAATGFANRGVIANDTMTGMNWSEVPVTILEMGYMSNAEDDRAMQDPTMQNNMVQGIANGIDAYFGF